jgi:ferric-dicitrate binding protein FerR (iron transport regulator)
LILILPVPANFRTGVMKEDRFQVLLEQYITNMIDKEGQNELISLLRDPSYRHILEKVMEEEWNVGKYEEAGNIEIGQLIEQNVMEKIRSAPVVPITRRTVFWMRKAAAVAILLIILTGLYYLITNDPPREKTRIATKESYSNEVKPGGDKAMLTLSNSQRIILDSAAKGILANEGGTNLENLAGMLSYSAVGNTTEVLYNTINIPRGGQYQVRLSDGTMVWLNAASSMRFPSAFPGNERVVALTGEAYFEVAHDAKKPFRVQVDGIRVEVLGTRFNINAYNDEGLSKATLVQGKVKISKGAASAILSPGQQARINVANKLSVVKNADTKEALAWKNGYFQFNNADIETVMKELARWYDVEIVYQGAKPQGHIKGEIPRTTTADKIIQILEASGVQAKLEGRKITVMQ